MGDGSSPSEPAFFETPAELRAWLDRHHGSGGELFVGAWKKATGKPSLTWQQIVDEALCYGWIDGVRRSWPGNGWVIRLTPRRRGSIWSAINVANVARLTAEGRMRPAGLAAFEARTPERTAIYSFERGEPAALEPAEEARFRDNAKAWSWFSARPPSFRRVALHWVVSAKRPETRERRLATLIDEAAAGRAPKSLTPPVRRPNPPVGPPSEES